MNNPINDMGDHYEFMTKQLRSLRHFERCLFAVWCADRLLISHADHLIKKFSQSDLQTLQGVLDDIWDSLFNGMIPEKDQLNALDMDFMEVDDGWTDPMREIDPIRSIVQQSIGMCILCCRRNDVGVSQNVAQSVIDGLDCKLEKNDPGYTPETLFEHPQIQQELETQLAMIKNLKGEYELVPNLRTMFR
ncbi:DUF416 family protein [Gimesia chilikensis]|uniref:DUF416 family protein n=1 Tax=Gimesia chilikensis TaxID=2605989 RepID=A0A517PKJ8_9PLAN|nr:DUF416 family protein [Gimesia chilikensis]QDT19871.1 hypothetical protein HG66A1_16390 [Gimesia chilikensis]